MTRHLKISFLRTGYDYSMRIPLVSVTMVTYNRDRFIEEAILSVFAQTFSDWELIIIDDGSTDTTANVVQKYVSDQRVRYIVNESNVGIVASRNTALTRARGKYIAVLDSDDVWNEASKLERQVQFLEQNEQYALVGCQNTVVINDCGLVQDTIQQPSTDLDIRKKILYKNPFTHSAVMFRKEIVERAGGYSSHVVGEDYDLILRVGREGYVENLPGVSVQYRKHGTNISTKHRIQALRLNLEIIRKYKADYPLYTLAWLRRIIRFFIGTLLFR